MSIMDIAEKMESALADVLPVYGRVPEFSVDDEPEKYAVYNITEFSREYAEGEDNSTQYLCRLAVFTPALDFALYKAVKAAMRAAGFGYSSGGQVGTDALYPHITHYYLDFVGVESNEQ